MPSNFTGSETINKEDLPPTQGITDVYIGVFFDGTNNNMLWTAKEKIKKYRDKLNKKKQNNLSEDDKKYINNLSEDDVDIIINLHENEYNSYLKDNSKNDEINSKKDFIKHKKYTKIDIETAIADKIVDNHTTLDENEWADFVKLQLSKEDKCRALRKGNYHPNCKNCKTKSHECDFLSKTDGISNINEWIIKNYKDNKDDFGKDAIRQYKNAHTIYKPTMCGGFSNIAILYSAYNPIPHETESKKSKKYNIYIEGSGATDISEKHFLKPELLEKMNINGLGFGLGETGVVALVSKAVYYVNNYIESIKSTFNKDQKVNIHFNVFGFSRGATCSRLFSYLVTRTANEPLGIREKEFADFYAKNLYKEDGRLHFLEDPIYQKSVDFLGIYDTVVSIGFLLQKDGYVNPLAWSYKNNLVDLMADNYKGNWHCNNVSEYGMYSTSSNYNKNHQKHQIKNILHICAMDEYRENFALTNVGKIVGANAVEIYIPGCHSDIGGGYYDGDEEQEILLKKKIKKGSEIEDEEWNYRRQSDLLHTRIDKLFHPIHIKIKKERNGFGDIIDDIDKVKVYRTKNDVKEKNVHFYETTSSVDASSIDKKTDNTCENKYSSLVQDLFKLGWLDRNWDNDILRQKIYLNGNEEPCTLRITDGPWYVKFKRNVKAGYSNIPLKMMIDYATAQLKDVFTGLFDSKYITKEYPIPYDLDKMSEEIKSKMEAITTGKRYWIHPKDKDYKNLRMKYLHFTSTYKLGHVSKSENGVKWIEGSPGNIANTPNQDLNGRICRIVYHGDKDDYDLNYMYEYGENLGNVHGDISLDIKFASDKENKD